MGEIDSNLIANPVQCAIRIIQPYSGFFSYARHHIQY